ncbi:MAG: hypothetical protein NVS3B25_09780 [Hymenobacter sp.]
MNPTTVKVAAGCFLVGFALLAVAAAPSPAPAKADSTGGAFVVDFQEGSDVSPEVVCVRTGPVGLKCFDLGSFLIAMDKAKEAELDRQQKAEELKYKWLRKTGVTL